MPRGGIIPPDDGITDIARILWGEKGDLKVGCQDGTCLEDGACLGAGAWGEALGNSLRDLPHRLYSL